MVNAMPKIVISAKAARGLSQQYYCGGATSLNVSQNELKIAICQKTLHLWKVKLMLWLEVDQINDFCRFYEVFMNYLCVKMYKCCPGRRIMYCLGVSCCDTWTLDHKYPQF